MHKTHRLLILSLAIFGAGCVSPAKQPPQIAHAPGIVPLEQASRAQDEPVQQGAMALPCLHFNNRGGFVRWLDAYAKGQEATAKNLAINASFPPEAPADLIQSLKGSQPPDTGPVSLCQIHRELGLATWSVQTSSTYEIYVGRGASMGKVSLPKPDGLNAPSYCLPKSIGQQEMIWVCKPNPEAKNWEQVHVNRRSGEIQAIRCATEKDGKTVEPGEGCLQ